MDVIHGIDDALQTWAFWAEGNGKLELGPRGFDRVTATLGQRSFEEQLHGFLIDVGGFTEGLQHLIVRIYVYGYKPPHNYKPLRKYVKRLSKRLPNPWHPVYQEAECGIEAAERAAREAEARLAKRTRAA